MAQSRSRAKDGGLGARLCAALAIRSPARKRRVDAEVAADMAQPAPMLAWCRATVGSGKTVVAALGRRCVPAAAAGRWR
jgi:ATP-dependent DNA helicase RecG